MAHFVIALLNDGRYNDAQVLSPTSAQAMLEQQFAWRDTNLGLARRLSLRPSVRLAYVSQITA
jgi:hypothetical protein